MSCNCGTQSVDIGRSIFASVGALQRANPLPPGRYWIDIIGEEHQSDFSDWAFENASNIEVISTEHFEAVRWPDCPIFEGECSPPRDWYLFEVLQPVVWDASHFGFPNYAGEEIQSSTDTIIAPDFSDYCDIGCQAEKVAIAAGVLFGGLSLIMVLRK